MYLQIIDHLAKLKKFVQLCLGVLKVGGTAFIREDLSKFNLHRDFFCFFFFCICLAKQNFMDLYWVLKKREYVKKNDAEIITFRDFLDKTQYTNTGIFAYEWIFGDNFISPGGAKENLAILKQLGKLKAGQSMLDIGVGIGGGARQAASEFGLHVLGLDLSSNMLSVAMDRLQKDKDTRVRYSLANVMECEYAPETFDIVYSRDCLQHNDDMPSLMKKIYRWLKPGGRVLITMYGKGHGELSTKFQNYVQQRHYYLKTLEQMITALKDAKFANVEGKNITPRFEQILTQELKNAVENKEEFLKRFSEKKYADLIEGWNDKLGYIADDNHNWIWLFAVKPMHS
ncbi:unnamed protein product [Enterobius vermicularis]|uniref:phosphoethanolamine N-methyltransferase n=1 Tax=Enterobius vermicularis TaxID=51028 RepID=A0A0N4VNY0_ENTVE|nr:unnamed protein product [Enterobius vermicularis]